MMICKADFEELFPELFTSKPAPVARQAAEEPLAACIARWEDDGGRPLAATAQRRTATRPGAQSANEEPELARAGALAATLPAAAAYGAAWTMLSGYALMASNWHGAPETGDQTARPQ